MIENRDYIFKEETIILQPGTFCNLDCSYCYLGTTNLKNLMSVKIAEQVADYIKTKSEKYQISFHGGEPLAVGIKHLKSLSDPFKVDEIKERVILSLQTNGTLLSKEWCLFIKEYDIGIGLSIDGSRYMSRKRKLRNGREAYDKILKGIEHLNHQDIPFGVLAVVSEDDLNKATELYYSIKSLGAKSLGINLEEFEGKNFSGVRPGEKVKTFWKELYLTWKEDKTLSIENFHSLFEMLNYASFGLENGFDLKKIAINTLPIISANGNVKILSPELRDNAKKNTYTFCIGNILEKTLDEIIAIGKKAPYVKDYIRGVFNCRDECEYFIICRGGFASNKFYERGTTNCTLTNNCRTSLIDKVNGVLEVI